MDAVVVTGGAGFIGSHLVDRLIDDGRDVVVLDSFDRFYDPDVKRRNLARAVGSGRLTLVEGDIRDDAAWERVFSGTRVADVVHLAARAGVRPSIEEPLTYVSVNLDGTARALDASRRAGVRRFVFGSSSSVYGNNGKVPFAESDPVDHPISPYAATKKAGELLCHTYHHLYGIAVASLRFFTVFGPRQRPDLAIHKFARRLAEGREIEQFGDGTAARDYTYVDDIVEGIVRALDRCHGWHVWNLGGSHPLPLSALVEKLSRAMNVRPSIRRLPMQPGDVERTWADIALARRDLEWEPRTDFDDGLERFLEWFRGERARA